MWQRPRVVEPSRTNPPETAVRDRLIYEHFLCSRSPDCSADKQLFLGRHGVSTQTIAALNMSRLPEFVGAVSVLWTSMGWPLEGVARRRNTMASGNPHGVL